MGIITCKNSHCEKVTVKATTTHHARCCHPDPAEDDHRDALTSCNLGLANLFALGTLQHDAWIHHIIEMVCI